MFRMHRKCRCIRKGVFPKTYNADIEYDFCCHSVRHTDVACSGYISLFYFHGRSFTKLACYALHTFDRYVDMKRRDFTEVICVDEVHLEVSRVCKYALVIQDFVSGEPLDLVISRRKEITEPYFAHIPAGERARVKYIVSDMYGHTFQTQFRLWILFM